MEQDFFRFDHDGDDDETIDNADRGSSQESGLPLVSPFLPDEDRGLYFEDDDEPEEEPETPTVEFEDEPGEEPETPTVEFEDEPEEEPETPTVERGRARGRARNSNCRV